MTRTRFAALSAIAAIAFHPAVLRPQGRPYDAKIKAAADAVAEETIAVRRDLHAHPELSTKEVRTSGIVADHFRKLGLEVRTGIAGTGVLGILRGGRPGPVVGYRADMDALPIVEDNALPFKSVNAGAMHACGHDIHTAVLMSVASVLARLKADLPGTVLFVAQPAEESVGGAKRMLEEGLFKDLKPAAMFAFHVDDTAPAGTIEYVPGYALANVDSFNLAVLSEGCHGASPHDCVDPIVVASQVVLALQVMVAREIDVHKDTVVTVGSFHAGSASNIIPPRADLRGTVRTYGDDQRRAVRDRIERTIAGACGAAGAKYELDYAIGTPATYNDPALLERAVASARRVLGPAALVQGQPDMGGEDFSYFGREVPSAMLLLGVEPKDSKATLHSPYFVADEAGIPVGVRVMATILWDYLSAGSARTAAK